MVNSLRKYLSCKRCGLWRTRRSVVLGRGMLPAEVCLIGEAPGKSEDCVGIPFVGKAGSLLNHALREIARETGRPLPAYFITNVVACLPPGVDGASFREPTAIECAACRPRLTDTLRLVGPKRVVFLGEVAEREAKIVCPDGVRIFHPSYIERVGGIRSGKYAMWVRDLAALLYGEEGIGWGNERPKWL